MAAPISCIVSNSISRNLGKWRYLHEIYMFRRTLGYKFNVSFCQKYVACMSTGNYIQTLGDNTGEKPDFTDQQDYGDSISRTLNDFAVNANSSSYETRKDSEKFRDVTFGTVRLDDENRSNSRSKKKKSQNKSQLRSDGDIKRHADNVNFDTETYSSSDATGDDFFGILEYENNREVKRSSSSPGSSSPEKNFHSSNSFVENQYFSAEQNIETSFASPSVISSEIYTGKNKTASVVDSQYFSPLLAQNEEKLENSNSDFKDVIKKKHILNKKSRISNRNNKAYNETKSSEAASNYFEEQYFSDSSVEILEDETGSLKYLGEQDTSVQNPHTNLSSTQPDTLLELEKSKVSIDPKNTEYNNPVTALKRRLVNRPVPNLENPETAYDAVMKMRLAKKSSFGSEEQSESRPRTTESKPRTTERLDSKGFRILSDQVPDIMNEPSSAVVNILHQSILYDDHGVVAIDKPYGLPSHGGPGVHMSVGKLLPDLAARLKAERLYLIHRLDRDTTGIILLARTLEVANRLYKMFASRQVIKRYWALTKGVPNPSHGVIDIPIAEGKVAGKYRMALRPYYNSDYKEVIKSSSVSEENMAITKFRVLTSHGNCALVECEIETGVKHQIRCHLAFGMNTPIIGDHKYSHFSKLAPQKLPPDILQRLGIRQTKVRYAPMHLHSKAIILPEFHEGRNIFIDSHLPKHFHKNMKSLKLNISKSSRK